MVAADKSGVTVWYNGEAQPTKFPLRTFKEDCVNWWKIQKVGVELPSWIGKQVLFTLDRSTPSIVTASVSSDRRFPVNTVRSISLGGQTLKLRHQRLDYASCSLQDDSPRLVFVPLWIIAKHGYHHKTYWDKLDGDILDESPEEAEFLDL